MTASCMNSKSKAHYKYTETLINCNYLYLECYQISESWLFGNFSNRYLTDSTNFRQFIGVYDEDKDDGERYIGNLKGDSIIIDKVGNGIMIKNDSTGVYEHSDTILERHVYSLSKLRKQHRCE